MKSSLKDVIGKQNLTVVNVPENMTKYYEVPDLTVNNYAKASARKKGLMNDKRNKFIFNWMLGHYWRK